ncbi:hypothetical protein ABMA28_012481 [Loxostege sticticalis]|uniref:Uncharacterized protein n=1 Tax=Loxostege sticticalis TaxID=481309 RepID=A0ABD0S400_LOXSC
MGESPCSVYSKLPEVYGENNRSHLKFEHIKAICNDRSKICKSNDTRICALRILNETKEFKDFENSCFLFLSNMCDTPGEGKLLCRPKFPEYNILEGGTCAVYHESRRQMKVMELVNATTVATTTAVANSTGNATLYPNTTSSPLRAILRASTAFSKMYEIDTGPDGHVCPLACPDTYNPVCMTANRAYGGKSVKLYSFVNHCKADLYYCKHFEDFGPPPDELEDVEISHQSWSGCAAFRYMQFARFSEVLSSMGHYGWLVGDDRYSRIIPHHQRRPDVGK